MKQNAPKIALILVAIGMIAAFFIFDLKQYFNLEFIKENQASFAQYYAENGFLTIGAFMGIYIVMAALSLPGAAMMTLLGGALFGLVVGTILVSFASTIGATLAFLAARYLFRDSLQTKYADRLKSFNDAFEKEGAFYLFTLRLIPAVPFFVINLVMGLTPIKTFTFYWVSQVGMLIGTIVYVNAGTQLGQIESTKDILSIEIIGSFVLLGITPLILKKVMNAVKKKREDAAPDAA